MKIAYLSEAVQLPIIAQTHPDFDRIRPLADANEPLHYSRYNHKGVTGVLAHTNPAPPKLDQLNNGFKCTDDLTYFRYGDLPDQFELSRAHGMNTSHELTLENKMRLSIPIAVCSAQTVSFSGMTKEEYVDKFAILANEMSHDFIESAENGDDGIPFDDPRVFSLVFLAIQKTYRVTQELLDELRWLTNEDINPIIEVIYGIDPKLSEQGQLIAN